MTLEDAQVLVRDCYAALQIKGRGLDGNGVGAVSFGTTPVYFEYVASTRSLTCLAHVYHFEVPAKPDVVEKLMAFERTKPFKTQGRLVYRPESKELGLALSYQTKGDTQKFVDELRQLAVTATRWATEGIEKAMA